MSMENLPTPPCRMYGAEEVYGTSTWQTWGTVSYTHLQREFRTRKPFTHMEECFQPSGYRTREVYHGINYNSEKHNHGEMVRYINALGNTAVKTVSYTHLDVYKRQPIPWDMA